MPCERSRRGCSTKQASFRDVVLSAYRGRCAISHLPEPRLLDAAHIIMGADEQFGQPVVSNCLPMAKLHHAALDAHLIGVDHDYRIHVSDRLLEIRDGPFLELGLKGIAGTLIKLPRRSDDRPDRDRLARRFEQFQESRLASNPDVETARLDICRRRLRIRRPFDLMMVINPDSESERENR